MEVNEQKIKRGKNVNDKISTFIYLFVFYLFVTSALHLVHPDTFSLIIFHRMRI